MNKKSPLKRVAVIGGGLAGLSAAHRLIELEQERGPSIDVTIFEAGSRLGGLVGTEKIAGYLVDVGADSFLTNKPGAVNLCKRLGIEHRLIPTDARFRGAFVLYDGRPVPVPEGFQLLSPTAIWPVITSPLFSVWGKLRLLMEWFIPRRMVQSNSAGKHGDLVDESLGDFARRRLGREALERLIQPLVGGIYTADPEHLSLAATIPRFLEMEREYGSLIRAAFHEKSPRASNRSDSSDRIERTADSSSGARYGLFVGLQGGMNDLVDALRKSVESKCQVRLNCPVASISEQVSGCVELKSKPLQPDYELKLADGTCEQFDAVIVAATAATSAKLLDPLDSQLSKELRGIEFASSALVVTGHQLADIRHPLDAFGLVVPHVERRRILAVSFSSRKFSNRAPAGRVLLRTFIGGAMQPELFQLSDEEMIEIVREELAEIFGVHGEPDFTRVYRYERAMPQYHVGHLERVTRIEALVQKHPRLSLAGIAYRGVGVPDVITSGEHAAEELFADQTK